MRQQEEIADFANAAVVCYGLIFLTLSVISMKIFEYYYEEK